MYPSETQPGRKPQSDPTGGAGPRRALVIGGGLIGSRVAARLAHGGDSVTVLSRSFSPWLDSDELPGLRLVEGRLPGDGAFDPLFAEADVVFFMAGSSTPALSEEDSAASIAALLEPAGAVLDLMRRNGPRRLVLASSGGTVYGRPSHLPTPENAATEPLSVHGSVSLDTERHTTLYAREHGLEPVILRFSNVYGPGQRVRGGFGVIAAWCEALADDRPLVVMGDGSVERDFLFVEDAAVAAQLAAESEVTGVFNAGSGESISLNGLIEVLAEVAGTQPDVEHRPARRMDVPITRLDCSALRAQTGWEPTVSLREGVEACWRWALRHR